MDKETSARLEALLPKVTRPARYTGGEVNQVVKPRTPGMTRLCFAFPDTYEVAMSHLGMKVIYEAVNREEDLACERAAMPWADMADAMKEQRIPLYSLETRTPLSGFDAVGFTLQYEMSYTNVLHMLSLGGIPVLSRDRGDGDPVVIAGGPCAYNPEPLADFVEAFLIGDGEEATVEMLRAIGAGRRAGLGRAAILRALSKVEGVYVPSLWAPEYAGDGTLSGMRPLHADMPGKVTKRFVRDLDAAPFPHAIPLPYTEAVHDRIVLEVMRGCTRGCRFCQAGMVYRPVRERSPETLVEAAQSLFASTGYEEISLSSLSTGDYSRLNELIAALNENFAHRRVSLSLPSLRVDGEVGEALKNSGQVKKSGLTLAPEAGTQRLRDVINKGVTERDVLRAVTEAFAAGWDSVKLYFMIGLPTETDEDLLGIADLVRKIQAAFYAQPKEKRARSLQIAVSASTFVPKPFTPFQWAAQITPDEAKRRQRLLRDALRMKGVTFSWSDPDLSRLEACFARGDRRMGAVLLRAYELGARLDGWCDQFLPGAWEKAFAETGTDPAWYASRERAVGELLPWDFIDIGVTRAFLEDEMGRALRAETTPDCRGACHGCGLTRFEGLCGA